MFTKRLHVFRAGPQISAQGIEREFSPDDLQEVVESYNPGTHEAPVVIGHSGDNDGAPSYGWIKKFVREGDNLYADVNFTDVAKDLIKNGHYKKVSVSFYSPSSPINPVKGKWSARHLALLGASPPAVKGLEPFSFSEKDGLFDFAATLSPETLFDEELGPTLINEKSPLDMLKDRLEEVRGQINDSLKDLKDSQNQQPQTDVSQDPSANQGSEIAPTEYAEKRRKKMGLEGAEVSEASQKLSNLETMAPEKEEDFDEGVTRKKVSGAHGQEVQVVEQVYDEGIKRKEAAGAHGHKVQVVEEVFEEGEEGEEDMEMDECSSKGSKKKMKKGEEMAMEMDESDEAIEGDGEYAEGVGHKTTSNGKVSFGTHAEKTDDPTGRAKVAKSETDSEEHRQTSGHGHEEDREGVTSDGGTQDHDRVHTSKNSEQEEDRVKTADSEEEDRWNDQPEAKQRAMNNDQFDDSTAGLNERQVPGVSEGKEPFGRDGGPTDIPVLVEESPSNEDIEVPLKNVKESDKVRVLYKKAGESRAPIKGEVIHTQAHEADYTEEVSDKKAEGGKVKFGHHAGKAEDVQGRGKTGRSESDSYADRQAVGKGAPDGREKTSADGGKQDASRTKTAKNATMEANRAKVAKAPKADEGDAESRWEGQPEGKMQAMDADQFSDGSKGLTERQKPGISDRDDPHGRDGGPTKVSTIMEEEPSNEDIEVKLQSTKGNKTVRVLHQQSGDKRAAVKGKPIPDHASADHAEGEADGLTRTPKAAEVSDGTDPRGRGHAPTKFPTLSEEDPDDLEMAVDVQDATKNKKVRIVRQASGDAPTLDHKEKTKDPMTKTGKGSTYGQKSPVMVDEEDEMEEEFGEDYCGMGSLGQAKAKGYPAAMFKELMELKAENDRLKREYEEQKVKGKKAKIAQFVENLYVDGKLTDGVIPQRQLQNYCEGLEFGTLEFAEGESPTTTLFALLERLPNMVYFGEVVSNVAYQDPQDEDLDPHERALRMVANGEASDYVEAIKQCIPWGTRS